MPTLLGNREVQILAEQNDHLANLGEEHDSIIQDFNELNQEVVEFEVPDEPNEQLEESIQNLRQRIDQMRERMIEWESSARGFIQKPSMTYTSKESANEDDLRQMERHVVHLVTMLKNDMTTCRTKLANNFDRIISEARSARNRVMASRSQKTGEQSLTVAKWGVWLAIISLFVSLGFGLFPTFLRGLIFEGVGSEASRQTEKSKKEVVVKDTSAYSDTASTDAVETSKKPASDSLSPDQ